MPRSSPGHRVPHALLAAAVLAVLAQSAAAQQPPPPLFPPQQESLPPPPVFPPVQSPPAPVFPAPVPGALPQPLPQPPEFAPQFAQPGAPVESPRRILKQMFAASLAAMTQTVGSSVLSGLTEAITGGITGWFGRRKRTEAATAAGEPLPQPAMPPPPALVSDPPQPVPAPVPQFFDAQTGAQAAPDPAFTQALAAPDAGGGVFAGLAFEVHAVIAGGATVPVNPATHEFRTGERFVLHYRPTLPGQMTVFNINPAGIQTQIDRVDLAAGQLAQLGPYEFAAMTGDEQLRLVLSPCSTPELLAATRDIVNVAATVPAAFDLAACSPATRSIRDVPTRDIRKVGLDGTTAFALDPVTAGEFDSGRLAPREVTIRFRHR